MKYVCGFFRHLPLILSVGGPLAFVITYGIALGSDHIAWLWPYISDTGTKAPESCVFGLLLNLMSFLLGIVVYLRYREVSEHIKLTVSLKIKPQWNRVAAVWGYLSCFGLTIVANFEETSQLVIHFSGAIASFTFGIAYFIYQTIFTYKINPEAKVLLWTRVILTIICIGSAVGFLAPIGPAVQQFKGKDMLKWTSEDGGYGLHLVSTFLEWVLMLAYCGFFATIYCEFRKFRIIPPQVRFKTLLELETRDDLPEETGKKILWI